MPGDWKAVHFFGSNSDRLILRSVTEESMVVEGSFLTSFRDATL